MLVVIHVHDLNHGRPAAQLHVRLDIRIDGDWRPVTARHTDDTGRCDFDCSGAGRGTYRLVCETDPYFVGLGGAPAYPEVTVTFRILDHSYRGRLVLLISPAGYMAYLGC